MSSQAPNGLPRIVPPGGAPVTSAAPAISTPPVMVATPDDFDPEAPDNAVLTFGVAGGIEILAARVQLGGQAHTANLAGTAQITGGNATIDFGTLRPLTRIDFSKADNGQPSRLLIQLGGTWFQPENTLSANFGNYAPGAPFAELITEQVLLTNVATASNVESRSFPANVSLRLTDGGVPFFFHRGDLRSAGVRVPDFGQQMALVLETCEPVNGICSIDLIARSEAFGTIAATLTQLVYRLVGNSLDALDFAARTRLIAAGGTSVFALPLPPGFTAPADRGLVTSAGLGLKVVAFGPTQAATDGHRGAIISEQFQVAQAVDFSQSLAISAVYLYLLQRTPQVALTLELREDVAGEPRGTVLAATALATTAPEAAFTWRPAPLQEPLTVAAGSRVWLVLKADQGEVEWRGDEAPAGALPAQFSTDRGNTWQAHPLAASYVFEQSLPDPAAPLTIRIAVGEETQEIVYDPPAFPLVLGSDSALVKGINQFIDASLAETGGELPASVPLVLSTESPHWVQVTLTQLDVTYTQALP